MKEELTRREEAELQQALDERADHIPAEQLKEGTAQGEFFNSIHKSLVARGTKLIVGPRGCGKTHLMRYTWLLCKEDDSLPLAIYVTFNRYYRLEPLLRGRANATDLFHVWVLARIIKSLKEVVPSHFLKNISDEKSRYLNFDDDLLDGLIGRLERGVSLTENDDYVVKNININELILSVELAVDLLERKRAVILMDDAALTLTPEYLTEFFDVVRVLRTQKISPKASVYPATDYGAKFHADHEAEKVNVWLSVNDPNYIDVMGAIAKQRFPVLDINQDVDVLLRYAAFGVPRAYLTMLREYEHGKGRPHQLANSVIESHYNSRKYEYESMSIKVPRFETLIKAGMQVFDSMIHDLKDFNAKSIEKDEKQLMLGVPGAEISAQPLVDRMFNLLIEAGMLYENPSVSHGEDRIYRRYTPHLAALISLRALSGGSRSSSASLTLKTIGLKSAKHPLRRSVSKLADHEILEGLRIDLPPCRVCDTPRLTDQQKFCHNCGSQLLDDSTFTKCMSLPLNSVPGLTTWQKEKVSKLERVQTIGDLLAIRDPGTELRKIHRVGTVRASKMIELVTSFVDDFLS